MFAVSFVPESCKAKERCDEQKTYRWINISLHLAFSF
jgi:hypothetical protein